MLQSLSKKVLVSDSPERACIQSFDLYKLLYTKYILHAKNSILIHKIQKKRFKKYFMPNWHCQLNKNGVQRSTPAINSI